jgi:hypothetical protein
MPSLVTPITPTLVVWAFQWSYSLPRRRRGGCIQPRQPPRPARSDRLHAWPCGPLFVLWPLDHCFPQTAGDRQLITRPPSLSKRRPPPFYPKPDDGREHPTFQLALVTSVHHYIRRSVGVEQIYDRRTDPFERGNLMASLVHHFLRGAFSKNSAGDNGR